MAYHGDFWLLIGTAAPVLALANVVTFAPSRRLARALRIDRGDLHKWLIRRAPVALSVLGILSCIDTLTLALIATHDENDGRSGFFGPAATAADSLVLALVTLAMQAVAVGMAERRLEEIKPHRPKPGRRRPSK